MKKQVQFLIVNDKHIDARQVKVNGQWIGNLFHIENVWYYVSLDRSNPVSVSFDNLNEASVFFGGM